MRTPLLLLAAATLVPAAAAQTTFLSESFETDGNGSRYAATEFFSDSESYFFRTDGAPIAAINGSKYSNRDGSFYFAGRNADEVAPDTNTVSFAPVMASSFGGDVFENLTLSFRAATQKQGVFDNDTDAVNDFLHLEYRADGGALTPCVWFESSASSRQGNFAIDANFDGFGEGAPLSVTALTTYSCSIPNGAAQVEIQVSYKDNGVDETFAMDLIELEGDVGVAPPSGITGSIAGGTCGPIPFNRPSQQSRCFPQITGTNNGPEAQRYTLFFRIEGTGGAAAGHVRYVQRGEAKPNAGQTISNKFRLQTFDPSIDPDGDYDLVLYAAEGSVAKPAAGVVPSSFLELDRVPFTKGAPTLRSAEDLSVFPNPAADVATLRFAVEQETAATVTVYDALGRQVLVAHEGVARGVVEAEVNAAALPAGLYVARLVTDSRTETLRFSVVR